MKGMGGYQMSKLMGRKCLVNILFSVAALTSAMFLVMPAHAGAKSASMSQEQKTAYQAVIREYLLDNPEIIREAISVLRKREAEAAAQQVKEAVQSLSGELLGAPLSPVIGNPKGDVTIVEFFDFRCGYCKRVKAVVNEVVKTDPQVRVVFKQLPVLGPESMYAAKAALAAQKQGKYEVFHDALMEESQLDEATVNAVAQKLGLDFEQIKRDMAGADVLHEIDANIKMSATLGINGTPGFVVGNSVAPGALDLDGLRHFVSTARMKKK
jgi:protein-disulfide isomerase